MRNYISAIQGSNGELTSLVEKVGQEFISYYWDLLGTTKHALPIIESVICCGPCIDAAPFNLLLAHVTNDVIKHALFSIGDEEVAGPNGYSSLFFKRAWSIVGDDFCAAIKDFFASSEILKAS